MKRSTGKIIVWFVCFLFTSIALNFFLSSCGEFRPSYANKSADNKLETTIKHNELGVRSHTAKVEDEELNNTIKKQSYELESGGYAKSDASGWKEGIIKNRFTGRQIRFDIVRGNEIINSYVLEGGQAAIIDKLPIGKYVVNYFEYTVKGVYLQTSWSLDVTNKANRSYQGAKYFFVISN